MIRTFHPIGQGAFYTEVFENFTVVYDCGSDTNVDLIQAEIRNTFEKGDQINALFISHLHADHVNGLEYLLERCTVHRLFLPFLTDDEKLQLVIHNSVIGKDNEFIRGLIENPSDTLAKYEDTKIFFIPIEDGSKEFNESEPLDFEKLQKSGSELGQNAKLISGNIKNWIFIPFNFQNPKRSILLKEELTRRGITIKDVNGFLRLWSNPEGRGLIREAYRSIPGNFNTNSLTLYSGPKNGDRYLMELLPHRMHVCRMNQCYCFGFNEVGCLYFGDYEAKGSTKWDDLYNKYEAYWESIGTVQIPHHGSRHSYNRRINQIKPMISVISAGYSNKYRHPHSSTIRNIIVDGGCSLVVNEKSGSRLLFEVFDI